jgi:hypothetical protein
MDVMVDIETTGTRPERTAMIQLSAVKFDIEKGEIKPDFFNAYLAIPPTRYWDEQTRTWWLKDKRELLQTILANGRPPAEVLREFAAWVIEGIDRNATPTRLWAKPIHFEWSFLESYFHEFGVPNPFGYRFAMDSNTFVKAKLGNFEHPTLEREIPFEGEAHNAIFDVIHQIRVLFKVMGHPY